MEENLKNATESVEANVQTISVATEKLIDEFIAFSPTIIWSAITLFIGFVLIKLLVKFTGKFLEKSKIDVTLHIFIKSVVKISLYVLLAITCAGMLGIETNSLVAALGAVGLALSLAVKDSLANVAGGMSVLLTKPFALGNYVDIEGSSGVVAEIGPMYTMLKTIDNKRIYIPNGEVAGSRITNYSSEPTRRLDLVFSIAYDNDIEKAKGIISRTVEKHPFSLAEPAPIIRACEHSNHSVNIACKVWVNSENYWDLNFDLYEQIKTEFDSQGISIPFNQLDIHIVEDRTKIS